MSQIKSVLFLLLFILYDHYTVTSFRQRYYRAILRYESVFKGFLRSWLDVLSMHDQEKVKRYVKIVRDELSNLYYKMAHKLANHVKELSEQDSQYILEKIKLYRRELDKNLPYKSEFFSAIDQAFNAQQASQLEDYIHNLKDWFFDYRLTIKDETRKLLREVILQNILKKLSARDQIKLEKVLKKAVREYEETTDDDEWEAEWAIKMELIGEMIKKNISAQLLLDW